MLQAVGDFFLCLPRFCGVMRRYVVRGGLQGAENNGGVGHKEGVIDQKIVFRVVCKKLLRNALI